MPSRGTRRCGVRASKGATTTSWIAEFKNRLTEFKADAYFIAIGYNDKGNITMEQLRILMSQIIY